MRSRKSAEPHHILKEENKLGKTRYLLAGKQVQSQDINLRLGKQKVCDAEFDCPAKEKLASNSAGLLSVLIGNKLT